MNQQVTSELVERIVGEFWTDPSMASLSKLMHQDHLFHGAEGTIEGIEGFLAFAEVYKLAFQQSYEIKQLVDAGSYATMVYLERGRFENDYDVEDGSGIIKATGQTYETMGVELYRSEDGLLVETWAGHESLVQYLQTGVAVIRDTRW